MGIYIFIIIVIIVVISNIKKQQKEQTERQAENQKARNQMNTTPPPIRGSISNKTIINDVNKKENDFSKIKGFVRDSAYVGKNAELIAVVSSSEKVVICGYCGAENIVPVRQVATYSCYFCREKL